MKLRYKFFLSFVILLSSLIVANNFFVSYGFESFEEELIAEEVSIAKKISKEIVRDVAESRTGALSDVLFDIKSEREDKIEYILVFDKKGYLLSHTYLDDIPKDLLGLSHDFEEGVVFRDIDNSDLFVRDIGVPVVEGVSEIGSVHLGVKGSYLQRIPAKIFLFSLVVGAICLFVGSFLFWIVVLRNVSNKKRLGVPRIFNKKRKSFSMFPKEKKKLLNIILFLFLFFGLAVVVETYSYYSVKNILEESIKGNLEALVHSYSHNVDVFLEKGEFAAIGLASDDFVIKHIIKINNEGYGEDVALDISNHLIGHDFLSHGDFYEVFVLDKNGLLVGSTNLDSDFGADFSNELFFIEGSSGSYVSGTSYDENIGSGSMIFSYPVFEHEDFAGELVGVVGFRMSIENLIGLLRSISKQDEGDFLGIGEEGDVYLVNNDGFMMTPSRFLKGEASGGFIQKVDTVNYQGCFDDTESGKIKFFKDFKGDDVIGINERVTGVDWCLLLEVSEEEMLLQPLNGFVFWGIFVFFIFLFLVFLIVKRY